MADTVRIEATKKVAKFFDRILADKKENREESRRKFKNGDLKISK